MAVVIYDDEWGARSTKVFGCSFKSITAQMGFNSQPIVFTVTVVEENDQDFTLKRDDVRSIQYVSFGELSILGIVQSWEKTTIDPAGTGIYIIRLTDCRTVLDSANIANVYSMAADININLIYLGSTEEDLPSYVSSKKGSSFNTIMSRVEASILHYGNDVFEVDMSELKNLTNSYGDGVHQYYIEGEIRSLVSTITEFCNAVGAEWWVESRRKSVTDNTIIIKIKTIQRLDKIENPNTLEMDELAALHNNHIIRRKDGYENHDMTTNKVIWGGIKRKLIKIYGGADIIKPFWGFDELGQPLLSPSYTMPDEPQYRRIDTTVEEMEDALNGDLDNNMDLEQLAALKRYVDNVWGKRFYFALNKNMMSDTEQDLLDYPEVIQAGWWEDDFHPQGVRQFDPDVLIKLTTEDGRWGPFVHLSELFTTGSGTIESPLEVHYATWAPVIHNSQNLISREGESYMKCTLNQYGRYVVITLPIALTRYYMNLETGELNENRITRHDSLGQAWIPMMDRGIRYGPWSNIPLIRSHVPLPGHAEVFVNKDLVPWTFGVRGISHATAMEQLIAMATEEIDILPGLPIINTGQLEVAGIPMVNIGQSIGLGGSITEIFIRFDNNGITTRYVMNLYTRELGEFKRRKQKRDENKKEDDEKEPKDEYPEIKDDLETPPEPEPAPETEEELFGPLRSIEYQLTGIEERLDDVEQELQYDKGGMGTIMSSTGGPFYNIRRTSYRDLSSTLAKVSNIFATPSWSNVRNLAETLESPGLLQPGTSVTIKFFAESEGGPYVPYIEQTPQVFSPPPLPE